MREIDTSPSHLIAFDCLIFATVERPTMDSLKTVESDKKNRIDSIRLFLATISQHQPPDLDVREARGPYRSGKMHYLETNTTDRMQEHRPAAWFVDLWEIVTSERLMQIPDCEWLLDRITTDREMMP